MNGSNHEHALSVTRVSKHFGGVRAVQSVDLTVRAGERRALIGPNGAGKTTLFNVIAGELHPDGGRILLFDEDITRASVRQRARTGLGRTYQISELFLELTVEQNLALATFAHEKREFALHKLWRSYKSTRQWVDEIAERVGLQTYLDERVGERSHGMQRQLEIGLALAMKPRIMMLDEPAAGLSPS